MPKKELRKGVMKKYKYLRCADVHASIVRRFYRHLGGQVAIKLSKTRITPNQVTICSFLFSIIASVLIILQSHIYLILAAVVLFISTVLDYADGSLARLKKQGSLFGVWLDCSLDNLSITILLICMTLHAIFKTQNLIFAVVGFSAILSFQIGKILFMHFKRTFKDASEVIEDERKHPIRSLFHFNELFILNLAVVFLLINKIGWFMLFCSVYGWVFYIGMFIIFTLKARKMNKILAEEEELHTK